MVLTPGHIGTIASRPRAHQGHAKPGAPQFFCIKCTGSPPMLFWSHDTQASRPQRGPQVEGPPASCLLFSTLGTVSYVSFFFFFNYKSHFKDCSSGTGGTRLYPRTQEAEARQSLSSRPA